MTPQQREQHRKAQRLLVNQTARKLLLKDHDDVFVVAALYMGIKDGSADAYAAFIEGKELPPFMEKFCINFLAGKIKDLVIETSKVKKARKK